MKLFKKCMTVALALCLLLSCLPGASAMGGWYPEIPASGPCGPDARYEIADGVLTISGTGPVTNLPSIDIFAGALDKVVIEEGITTLSQTAAMCFRSTIIEIECPQSLCYVGELAFSGTKWLEDQTDEFVIVGNGILIDYHGPGGKVTLPEGVRYVVPTALAYKNVTEAVNPDGTPSQAWYYPWLEKDVVTTESGQILECKRFLVMDGVLLDYQAYHDTLTVPEEVRSIAPGGLYGDLAELTIPETVTELAPKAIRGGDPEKGSPLLLRTPADSAAARYAAADKDWLYRIMPQGQDNSSLLNFILREEFYERKFYDVTKENWYHEAVGIVYELGLMEGRGKDSHYNDLFAPKGDIKLSEAVTVAARVRDIYYDGQTDFTTDGKWYQPYVDYAVANGMLAEAPADLDHPATRAEFAALLAAALPEKELKGVNDITFTDVDETHPNYAAIMTLAKAGVMQGRGEGIFDPDAPVKRCEAAAMLSRSIRPEQRIGAE